MSSTAAKSMFLHSALVVIGLIASTFGNHFGNQLAGDSAAEEKVRGEVSSQSLSTIQAKRASNTSRIVERKS